MKGHKRINLKKIMQINNENNKKINIEREKNRKQVHACALRLTETYSK